MCLRANKAKLAISLWTLKSYGGLLLHELLKCLQKDVSSQTTAKTKYIFEVLPNPKFSYDSSSVQFLLTTIIM